MTCKIPVLLELDSKQYQSKPEKVFVFNIDKFSIKLTWKFKESRILKVILQKDNIRTHILLDFVI